MVFPIEEKEYYWEIETIVNSITKRIETNGEQWGQTEDNSPAFAIQRFAARELKSPKLHPPLLPIYISLYSLPFPSFMDHSSLAFYLTFSFL